MSTASNKEPESGYTQMLNLTFRGCDVAEQCAAAVAEGIGSNRTELLDTVKQSEEELDTLDREINEGVTQHITQSSSTEARELLACLKFIIELERIGDLLLGFANRAQSVISRLDPQDNKDLATMAAILEQMLRDDYGALRKRNLNQAVAALRADAELDRLRNLIFVRHIENPEGLSRQESFHVVFMAQSLERAGDHAKNLAEEVVHLVSGRSVRHLLRSYDKPFENMFVDWMRQRGTGKRS